MRPDEISVDMNSKNRYAGRQHLAEKRMAYHESFLSSLLIIIKTERHTYDDL